MVKEISKTDAGGMNLALFFLILGSLHKKIYFGEVKGGLRPRNNPKTLYNFHF